MVVVTAAISSAFKEHRVRQKDSILLGWIRIAASKVHKTSFFISDKGKTLRMAPKGKSNEDLE